MAIVFALNGVGEVLSLLLSQHCHGSSVSLFHRLSYFTLCLLWLHILTSLLGLLVCKHVLGFHAGPPHQFLSIWIPSPLSLDPLGFFFSFFFFPPLLLKTWILFIVKTARCEVSVHSTLIRINELIKSCLCVWQTSQAGASTEPCHRWMLNTHSCSFSLSSPPPTHTHFPLLIRRLRRTLLLWTGASSWSKRSWIEFRRDSPQLCRNWRRQRRLQTRVRGVYVGLTWTRQALNTELRPVIVFL